jgi:hypothetical protein
MVMKRFLLVLAALAPLGTGACNKPTPEDCRKAISHWQELLGIEAAARNADIDGEVRRCRGGSTKEAVACAINARTLAELNACAFRSSKGKKADKDTAPPPSAPTPSAPTPSAPPPGTPTPGTTTPSTTTPDTPSK